MCDVTALSIGGSTACHGGKRLGPGLQVTLHHYTALHCLFCRPGGIEMCRYESHREMVARLVRLQGQFPAIARVGHSHTSV